MKFLISTIVLMLLSPSVRSQAFEGRIVYKYSCKSKTPGMSDQQLTALLGDEQVYYARGGDYKSVMNGSMMQWQLYVHGENRLYNKMKGSEVLLWNDGAENADSVLQAEVHKEVTTILGYLCDELVLTCLSGVQKYYYSSRLAVDPSLFVKHRFGNWYEYVRRAGALPLRSIVENAQFIVDGTAIVVEPMKLDPAMFTLPAGTKAVKSPQ